MVEPIFLCCQTHIVTFPIFYLLYNKMLKKMISFSFLCVCGASFYASRFILFVAIYWLVTFSYLIGQLEISFWSRKEIQFLLKICCLEYSQICRRTKQTDPLVQEFPSQLLLYQSSLCFRLEKSWKSFQLSVSLYNCRLYKMIWTDSLGSLIRAKFFCFLSRRGSVCSSERNPKQRCSGGEGRRMKDMA